MFSTMPQELADEFPINCKGDCCVGDEVVFIEAVFEGTYPNNKLSHYQFVTAKIIKDSYGKQKQQHTFTLETKKGRKLIKGRNLYRYLTRRKPWLNEDHRKIVLAEKHSRGNEARKMRAIRKSEGQEIGDE